MIEEQTSENQTSESAVERIYRAEGGRVLATLIGLLGDFDLAEEVWLPESGGAMLGTFRSLQSGQVAFYEILTLTSNASGQLELRLKHFHPDLKGWEERDQVQVWALTRVEGEAFAFGPIVLRREGAETLVVTVTMKLEDGSRKDEVFRFRRAE